MPECYQATARILDAPVRYEDGLRIIDALVKSDLLDPDDHTPCEPDSEYESGRSRILEFRVGDAVDGINQLVDAGLRDALVNAAIPFAIFDLPDRDGYAGRCVDWQPGWDEPRDRDWDVDGPLLSAARYRAILAHAGADGSALAAALRQYFTEVFDEPTQAGEYERCSLRGVSSTITRSAGPDAAPVVFVDTTHALAGDVGSPGPRIRIGLNDAPVYVGVDLESPDDDDDVKAAA
jgi:hypothetical protein